MKAKTWVKAKSLYIVIILLVIALLATLLSVYLRLPQEIEAPPDRGGPPQPGEQMADDRQ